MSENMKPSGIAWIGNIPESWELSKIRFVTALRVEQGLYCETDKYIGLENISSYDGKHIETESEYEVGVYDVYKSGDVLFSKLRPYLAKAMIASDNGFCTGELSVIKKYLGDNRFLFYYLLSDGFLKMVDASTYGAKMPRASWEYIKNLQIPMVENIEQTLIANFLDEQCEKIDSIAADIEKQIEVLQKYKKSLITETVTKGLDKSVPMKDSGIEWIGEIPEHWEVKRLKFVSKLKTGTTPSGNEGINYDDEGINWFTPADFNPNMQLSTSEKFIDEQAIKLENITIYPENSVLLVAIGATVGKIGYTFDKSYSNQQITAIIPNAISGKYLLYYIASKSEYIKENALYTTLPIINNAYLGSVNAIVPLEKEQTKIANYLDQQCSKIDSIIESKKEQLTKIIQHKKSLIYEYVTGKKRVKGVTDNGN